MSAQDCLEQGNAAPVSCVPAPRSIRIQILLWRENRGFLYRPPVAIRRRREPYIDAKRWRSSRQHIMAPTYPTSAKPWKSAALQASRSMICSKVPIRSGNIRTRRPQSRGRTGTTHFLDADDEEGRRRGRQGKFEARDQLGRWGSLLFQEEIWSRGAGPLRSAGRGCRPRWEWRSTTTESGHPLSAHGREARPVLGWD